MLIKALSAEWFSEYHSNHRSDRSTPRRISGLDVDPLLTHIVLKALIVRLILL